jgi:hypothetical protein
MKDLYIVSEYYPDPESSSIYLIRRRVYQLSLTIDTHDLKE